MEVIFKVRNKKKLLTVSIMDVPEFNLEELLSLDEILVAVPDDVPTEVLRLRPYYRRRSSTTITLYCEQIGSEATDAVWTK